MPRWYAWRQDLMEETGGPQQHDRSPSGWFPDPWRCAQHRFFDGHDWTGHVANNGEPFVDHGELSDGSQLVLPPPSTNAGTSRTSATMHAQSRRTGVWVTVGIAAAVLALGGVVRMRSTAGRNELSARRSSTTVPTNTPSPVGEPLAICHDGTKATNSDLTATCSSHAGVDRWLADYGTCADGIIVKLAPRDTCRTHGGFGYVIQNATSVRVEDRLAANVRFTLTSGDVRNVSTHDLHVVVTVKIQSGLTEGLTKNDGRFRVAETLQALAGSDLPPALTTVTVEILIDFVNAYGETHERPVITATYTHTTLERIVFTNMDATKILLLADAGLEIDPSFTKGNGS
jgi:hypothetical protein